MSEFKACPFCGIEVERYSNKDAVYHPVSPCILSGHKMCKIGWNHRTQNISNTKRKLIIKAIDFLKQHADLLSNHSCNDIYDEFYDGWSDKEKKELVEMLNKWNGHDENLNEEYKNLMYHDSIVCSFVADLLNNILKDFISPTISSETKNESDM